MNVQKLFRSCFFWLGWVLILASPVQAQVFDWQEFELPENVTLTDVAASPDRLIALGFTGGFPDITGVVYTSTNGSDWQLLEIGAEGARLGAVAFIQDQWLIGRFDGDLHRSTDGLSWSIVSPPETLKAAWNSFLEIDDEIWLVGNGGGANARIVASADLLDWQLVYENGPGSIGGPALENVVGSVQQLVGLATDPPPSVTFLPQLWMSGDGSSWVNADLVGAYDVLWNGERFLAIAFWEPPLNPIGQLVPGGEWQFPQFTEQATNPFQVIAANRDYLLLTGNGELTPRSIVISVDGGNAWVEQDISALNPEGFATEAIAWRNGWIGVGNSIITGTPQQPQAVPALSGWSWLILAGLLALFAARILLQRKSWN